MRKMERRKNRKGMRKIGGEKEAVRAGEEEGSEEEQGERNWTY